MDVAPATAATKNVEEKTQGLTLPDTASALTEAAVAAARLQQTNWLQTAALCSLGLWYGQVDVNVLFICW